MANCHALVQDDQGFIYLAYEPAAGDQHCLVRFNADGTNGTLLGTNTLCAKANDISLSRIGLDLKAVVEQFREQVQNIE